jgi:hypothetical protein
MLTGCLNIGTSHLLCAWAYARHFPGLLILLLTLTAIVLCLHARSSHLGAHHGTLSQPSPLTGHRKKFPTLKTVLDNVLQALYFLLR